MKLIAPKGRVIIKIDLESKNSHTFADGTKIRLERQYDNFNMRYVKPVNAEVVNANKVPEGSEILIHHNATHDTYRLFNYLPPTQDASTSLKFYSIPESECFFWREKVGAEWKTLDNFVTALRVYKPYLGSFEGIEPTLVKNKLYITSGEYEGKVVEVLNASDYQVIYQGDDGSEKSLIRVRHFEFEENEREEIVAIDHGLTEKVKLGEFFVGYDKSNAQKLN